MSGRTAYKLKKIVIIQILYLGFTILPRTCKVNKRQGHKINISYTRWCTTI